MDPVTTAATIPATLAVVELAKQFGVKGKWSTLLSVFVGMAFFVIEDLVINGEVNAATSLTKGFLVGLSASGLYDTAKTAGTNLEVNSRTEYIEDEDVY